MTVVLNRNVSCRTMPIWRRIDCGSHIAYVDAVDPDRAGGDIVEAREQVDDSGLACAGGSDDGDGLAGLGGKGYILQNGHAVFILMGDVIEVHFADDLRGRSRAPGLSLHARDLIQQAEDAFGAGEGVLDIGPQDGDLLDGLVEALDIGEEGYDQTEGNGGAEQRLALEHIPAADAGDDGKRNVAERFESRGERRCERDGANVGVTVGRVDLLELLDVLIGAVEGLHLAHGRDALLQLGIHVADLLAARAECLACLGREVDRGKEHQRRQRQARAGRKAHCWRTCYRPPRPARARR